MGSQKSTTKVENKQLEGVLGDFRSHYAPGGQWSSGPQVDPSSPASQTRANQLIAPQSQDTQDAYASVRSGIGAWQPGMDTARSAITSGMAPTGQKIDFQGGGWSTGADGKAVFNTGDAYNSSYNQHTDQVLDHTLSRLGDQYGQQKLSSTDAALKAGSFGGSRQAVRDSLDQDNYLRNVSETSANAYSKAHESALAQIAQLYGMGSGTVGANNQLDAANADRSMAGGKALSDLETVMGQMRAGDANALAGIGQHQQDYEQARRDAVMDEQWKLFQTPADLMGRAMNGASSLNTTTQGQSGGTGSMLLGAGLQGLGMFFSDEKAKKDKKAVDPNDALEELRQLTPQSYSYTDDAQGYGAPAGERTGFMAQDLEAATGEPSPEMPGGYKGVDIAEMIGKLTHAVLALDSKIGGKKGGGGTSGAAVAA